MPLTYRINPDARILLIRGDGLISQPERLAALRAWTSDPAYGRCTAALCDFSTARSTPRLADVHELIRVMREVRSTGGPAKLAMVTPRPIAFGIARVFQELVQLAGFRMEVRVFRLLDAARLWLRPGDASSPLEWSPLE